LLKIKHIRLCKQDGEGEITYSGAEKLLSDGGKLLSDKGFEVICCYATSYNQSADKFV
jgi:hypothetical protein